MLMKKRPQLIRTPDSDRAVREAYEATLDLRRSGVTGFVLLKLTVGKDGCVESVKAVLPKLLAIMRTKVVAIDSRSGKEFRPPPPHTLQPALCEAAKKAALTYRFEPATLMGRPVRYRGLRRGFSFDAPVDSVR